MELEEIGIRLRDLASESMAGQNRNHDQGRESE